MMTETNPSNSPAGVVSTNTKASMPTASAGHFDRDEYEYKIVEIASYSSDLDSQTLKKDLTEHSKGGWLLIQIVIPAEPVVHHSRTADRHRTESYSREWMIKYIFARRQETT